MQNKEQSFETNQYLVNGTKCQVSVDNECLIWTPVTSCLGISRCNHKIGRVDFSKIIGSKRSHQKKTLDWSSSKQCDKQDDSDLKGNEKTLADSASTQQQEKQQEEYSKIKVYYSKRNKNKTTGQLLKLKKLVIEAVSSEDKASNQQIETSSREKDEPVEAPVTGLDDSSGGQSRVNSESSSPPSCYASEGSSGQLSSLSNSSSAASKSASVASTSSSKAPKHNTDSANDINNPSIKTSPISGVNPLNNLAKRIEDSLDLRRKLRPKRLLVFVNPFGGKGQAAQLFKSRVRRLFNVAGVEAKLVITKHANHARDTIEDPQFNVEYFDGIVCVGGDGMFSELMNGLLFRYNREQILTAELRLKDSGKQLGGCKNIRNQSAITNSITSIHNDKNKTSEKSNVLTAISDNHFGSNDSQFNGSCETFTTTVTIDSNPMAISRVGEPDQTPEDGESSREADRKLRQQQRQLVELRLALGGIGQQFVSPPIPIGVIGAGSTDANSFGLIGTNDVITATLNIILGNQIKIDICSVHSIREDRLLRFVSTFVAYGYFGDVIRESEKLRWLGPSRYDVTGFNNLVKNRAYEGLVRILASKEDGSPRDLNRCHTDCAICQLTAETVIDDEELPAPGLVDLKIIERQGPFIGVNAAVTACRCPQTKKGFSPNNHLANGCLDLILVRPCSRVQYVKYLMRTGWTKKSAFDLKYVEAFRCRQFEFVARNQSQHQPQKLNNGGYSGSTVTSTTNSCSSASSTSSRCSVDSTLGSEQLDGSIGETFSSWNVDGEILNEQSVRVKVNNQLLRVFGTGEPLTS